MQHTDAKLLGECLVFSNIKNLLTICNASITLRRTLLLKAGTGDATLSSLQHYRSISWILNFYSTFLVYKFTLLQWKSNKFGSVQWFGISFPDKITIIICTVILLDFLNDNTVTQNYVQMRIFQIMVYHIVIFKIYICVLIIIIIIIISTVQYMYSIQTNLEPDSNSTVQYNLEIKKNQDFIISWRGIRYRFWVWKVTKIWGKNYIYQSVV